MIPYQNVLWLSNAVLQASIVILTVVAAFLIFFLTFSWSYLQKAKELERKELSALNDGKLVVRRLVQSYTPEILKVYESWFNKEPEAIGKIIGELSLHQVIARINVRQRLLLFFFHPRVLADFFRVFAVGVGFSIFVLYIKRKWRYLRTLWITFCIFTGMPIDAFRKYVRPEIMQWAILHELSEWFPSELVFPLQLYFAKQFSTSSPPVSFYPNIERGLFARAKQRNMPKRLTQELLRYSRKCSDDRKKKLEGIIARIDTYRTLTPRFSMFLKTRGRVFLKAVVGSLIVLCTVSALLSLLVISGVSPADPIAGNLVRIAMSLLISAIMGVCIVVALLLKSF